MAKSDPVAERAVLGGIFHHGNDAFLDVCDLITPSTFTIDSNEIIYRCLVQLVKDDASARPDLPGILSVAKSLGLSRHLEKKEELQHLRGIMNLGQHTELPTVRKMAAKIRKLEFVRRADASLEDTQANLDELTGDESIDHIRGLIETPVFDLTSQLADTQNAGVVNMGEGALEYITYLMNNPREMMGISTGFPNYDESIGGGVREEALDIIAARQKEGKAQPLDAIVQTPSGPRAMGDLHVGDEVLTPTGVSKIASIYPQGKKAIYRVYFNDGGSCECCEDHLWLVQKIRHKHTRVLPLKEIMRELYDSEKRRRWSVPLPQACNYIARDVPISPYLLGLLIGDGGMSGQSIRFTNVDQELLDAIQNELIPGYKLKHLSKIDYVITGRKGKKNYYIQRLRVLGLFGKKSKDKFIPDVYKYNSIEIRLAFLQGLMDTDGTVDERNNCSLSTTSYQLAVDTREIVESLGGICKIGFKFTSCNGKRFHSYTCRIRFDDNMICFRLERKRKRCRKRAKPPLRRHIDHVEYVGDKEAQCIKLECPQGLYLTNHCIVTHNTSLADNMGLHVAQQGIWALNVDTEMSREQHQARILANLSGLDIRDIEKGKCRNDPAKRAKLEEAAQKLASLPYDYFSAKDFSFEDTLSHIRRWLFRKVGLDENGRAKPCVIFYDWLKLNSPGEVNRNLAEYQLLGFITSSLKNFMARYGARCVCFAQLNRDGIDTEDTSVIRGSDRILDFCTSFALYKKQSDDELSLQEGPIGQRYTHKLITLLSRFGPAMKRGEYINVRSSYEQGKVVEGPIRTRTESPTRAKKKKVLEDDDGVGQTEKIDF